MVTFLHVECSHFNENDTFFSGKRVIFRRRILTGGLYSTSKMPPGHYFTGVLFYVTPDVTSLHSKHSQSFLKDLCCFKQSVHMLTNIIQMLLHLSSGFFFYLFFFWLVLDVLFIYVYFCSFDIRHCFYKMKPAVLVLRYYVATKFKAL